MKKKLFFFATCVVALALLLVRENSSMNSIITSNIEALSYGDGGSGNSVETAPVYKIETNPDAPGYYAPYGTHTMKGSLFSSQEHSIWDYIIALLFSSDGTISGDKYWCTLSTAQVQTTEVCYEIVVRP